MDEARDEARRLREEYARRIAECEGTFPVLVRRNAEGVSARRMANLLARRFRIGPNATINPSHLMIVEAMTEETGDPAWSEYREDTITDVLLRANLPEFEKNAKILGVDPDGYADLVVRTLAAAIRRRLHPRHLRDVRSFMSVHGIAADAFGRPPLREIVDREAARLLRNLSLNALSELGRATGTDCERLAFAAARERREFDPRRVIQRLRNGDKDVLEAVERIGLTADDFPGALPPGFVTGRLPEKMRELLGRDAWESSFRRLLKIQARSARTEHDPWLTDFDPLVETLEARGAIDRSRPEDGESLVDFVRQFGMVNAPLLAEIFVELKRGMAFAELSDDNRRRLMETIGGRVERMTTEQLVNEMKLVRARLVGDLLNDRIPQRLSTELGMEMLAATVGVTRWKGDDDSPAELVAALRRTLANESSRASLEPPDAYFDRRDPRSGGMDMAVRRASRRPAAPETRERAAREIAELLSERPGEPTAVGKFARRLARAASVGNGEEEAASDIVKGLFKGKSAVTGVPDIAADLAKPKEAGEWLRAQMDELAQRANSIPKDDWLALSIALMQTKENAWVMELRRAVRADGTLTAEALERLDETLRFYVFEHVLAEDQKSHGDHENPLGDDLLRVLRDAWDLETGREDKHPVLLAAQEAESLRAQMDTVVLGDETTLSLVATGAVLRVFSGDVADACYTSKHRELADGEFPGVRSLMFVSNRGEGKERIVGSVLFVEAVTPAGEKVLVIRANNPRQNVLGTVSADDLVEQTIRAAVRVAERGGFDLVVLPPDFAGQSSSNRPEVSKIYRTRFRRNRRVRLVESEDTTFNGYKVWDDKGPHGVAVVWEKKTGRIE